MKNNYIALGGLFASLHFVFLLISKFVVGSELILVLFLPVFSTIYTLKANNKSLIAFVIATILFCSIFDIVSTLIYIVPSLMCGISYGLLRKNNVKELSLLYITSFIHMIGILFSFSIIALLFKEVRFFEIWKSIFGVEGKNLIIITLVCLFIMGMCEAIIVHMVSENELAKFYKKCEKNDSVPKYLKYLAASSLAALIAISFVDESYVIFASLLLIICFVPYIVYGASNLKYKKSTFCLMIGAALLSAFAMQYLKEIYYSIVPIFICSPLVINNFKDNEEKKLSKEE